MFSTDLYGVDKMFSVLTLAAIKMDPDVVRSTYHLIYPPPPTFTNPPHVYCGDELFQGDPRNQKARGRRCGYVRHRETQKCECGSRKHCAESQVTHSADANRANPVGIPEPVLGQAE